MFDLVNWDPFDDDPFEMEFLQNHYLYFPRIHWAWTDHRMRVPHPLVTRNDKQNFQLSIDVKGFDSNELSLKLVGRELLITGDHVCERSQKKPCFQRRFCWRRTLPENVDLSSVKAVVTESNMLEIKANKKQICESDIPIAVRETPRDQGQHQTNNQIEHEQVVRPEQEKKMEEEATVEIVPDETEGNQ